MKKITKLKNGRKKVVTTFEKKSRVQAQFQDSTDINKIMKKYHNGEDISSYLRVGQYVDNTMAVDLKTAMEITTQANSTFNDLPSEVRERFSNSPLKMLEFLENPKNDQEAIELGFKVKKENKNVTNPTINTSTTNDQHNTDTSSSSKS